MVCDARPRGHVKDGAVWQPQDFCKALYIHGPGLGHLRS